MRLKVFICLVLAGVTLGIYWPVRHFYMIDLDDPMFLHPEAGLTLDWHGLKLAMTGVVVANWNPATNLSFLLMHHIFGRDPQAEHVVNALFHAASAALLFLVLAAMTKTLSSPFPSPLPSDGSGEGTAGKGHSSSTGPNISPSSRETVWLCAFVTAIFAWHPLRVESVAWISERKDVLYVFFMLLALLCYTAYAQGKNAPGRGRRMSQVNYILALFFFVLSLLSKATVVTFPFLLLLVDYWPLGRFNQGSTESSPTKELIKEKIPFFALTAVFCVVTFWVHKTQSDIRRLSEFGVSERIENTILSYVNYLGKFFWPTNLAVPYPYIHHFDFSKVLLAGFLLATISVFCVLQLRRRPYLAVGWFWYLGTMVPVIGLVQVGDQAMADRHTYIPLIGPCISLTWLIGEWAVRKTARKYAAMAAGIFVLAALVMASRRQLNYWQNADVLFVRTIAVTPGNFQAERCLAAALAYEGRFREAAVHYREAIALAPKGYQTHYQLAVCLTMAGRRDEALAEYRAAVSRDCNMNDYVSVMDFADSYIELGQTRDTMMYLETAVRLEPDSSKALNDLAWALATCPDASARDGARAVELGERACELTGYTETVMMGTLAAAYAEAGRFDDAVAMAGRAIANAQKEGETVLAQRNEEMLKLFREHKAYHE